MAVAGPDHFLSLAVAVTVVVNLTEGSLVRLRLVVRHEDVLSSSVGPAPLTTGLTARSARGGAEVTVLNTEGLVFV